MLVPKLLLAEDANEDADDEFDRDGWLTVAPFNAGWSLNVFCTADFLKKNFINFKWGIIFKNKFFYKLQYSKKKLLEFACTLQVNRFVWFALINMK